MNASSTSPDSDPLSARSFSETAQYTARHPTKTFVRFKQLIILFLLIVGLIPGSLGLVGIYNASRKELVNSKGLYFKEVARFTAFQVERIITGKMETIERLARLPMIQNIVTFSGEDVANVKEIENIRKIILPELARNYFLANIYNAEGKVVFSNQIGVMSLNRDFSNFGFGMRVVKSGGVYISDVQESQAKNGDYFIELYAPILYDDGEHIGVIQARHSITRLFDTVNNVTIGQTGHANLLVSSGEILICPIYPPRSHRINPGLMNIIAAGGAPGWTITGDDAHGSSGSIVGYAPVNLPKDQLSPGSFGDKSWYIFTRQEPSETFQSIENFKQGVIVFAFVLVLLGLSLGFIAWRQILKAQKSHQVEVIYREKADSVKSLMVSFQQLTQRLLDELSTWLDEIENGGGGERRRPEKLRQIRRHLLSIDSVMKHLAYYAQTDEFDLEPVGLSRVLGDAVGLLDYIITGKGVRLSVSEPDEPVVVLGQPKLLNIVFMNIILNAIHAVDASGEVSITIEKQNGWGVLSVRDNGVGIPKQKIDHVFDPFFTTKKGKRSYGLGLSVSRGIIERHNGVIMVQSSEGNGTDVVVKLQLAEIGDSG